MKKALKILIIILIVIPIFLLSILLFSKGNIKYTEYDEDSGIKHDAWRPCYDNPEVFELKVDLKIENEGIETIIILDKELSLIHITEEKEKMY